MSYQHKALDLRLPASQAPLFAKRTFVLTIDNINATEQEPFFAIEAILIPVTGGGTPYTDPIDNPYTDSSGDPYVAPASAEFPVVAVHSGQVFGSTSPYAGQPIVNPVIFTASGEPKTVGGIGILSSGRDAHGTLITTDIDSISQVIAYGGDTSNNP